MAKSNILALWIDGVQMNISGPLLVPLMQNHQRPVGPKATGDTGTLTAWTISARTPFRVKVAQTACLSQTP